MVIMKNILWYKFVNLDDLENLQQSLLEKAKSLELLGKILIAEEGINGCVSGSDDAIEEYMTYLKSFDFFADTEFKITDIEKHTFKKMFVRIRDEIITFKLKVNLENKAPYIEPQELNDLLDSNDDVVIIDARNDYESKIGKFKNAIAPDIKVFSELPKFIEQNPHLKDKQIVTYCTGGIRCEKASAYLIENGFTNVKQLHGGIIKYGQIVGDKYWEGKCFVFDKRGALDIDPSKPSEDISHCELCSIPCSTYHNCKRVECDRYAILCDDCFKTLDNCCSKSCRGILRQEKSDSKNVVSSEAKLVGNISI